MLIALQEKHYGYPLFRCMKSSVFHARSEGVVMAADSGQKNIQIVGTASMNTYDVALRVGKTKQLVCNGTTGKMVWKSDRFDDLQGRRE